MTKEQMLKVAFGALAGYLLGRNPALTALVGAYIGYRMTTARPVHVPSTAMLPEVQFDTSFLDDLANQARKPQDEEVIEMQALDDDHDWHEPGVWSAEY